MLRELHDQDTGLEYLRTILVYLSRGTDKVIGLEPFRGSVLKGLKATDDIDVLELLQRQALQADTLQEFREIMDEILA